MVNERGLEVHHTTVFRWVQQYAPELDKRCRPHLRPTNDSWRVDETYIKIKGKDRYLGSDMEVVVRLKFCPALHCSHR